MIPKPNSSVVAKLLIVLLVLVFLTLQWSLWGERGVWRWFELKRAGEEVQSTNDMMQKHNEDLARDVEDLKTGFGILEEQAREDLGMVKKGETFYRIIERNEDDVKESEEE